MCICVCLRACVYVCECVSLCIVCFMGIFLYRITYFELTLIKLANARKGYKYN